MDMIERVARAIFATVDTAGDTNRSLSYDELWPPTQGYYLREARAAIEAMREPTEAMITAGYVDKHAHHEIPPHRVWPAMIDAALATEPVG